MERLAIIFVLFALYAAYWWNLFRNYDKLTAESATGLIIVGMLLVAPVMVIIFNLGEILNL